MSEYGIFSKFVMICVFQMSSWWHEMLNSVLNLSLIIFEVWDLNILSRYHGGPRQSSDDSFHSLAVIPPSALDKPTIMKCYHRRRTTRWGVTVRSPTMVMLHDTRFVECRWWNDSWTVKTVVTWRLSTSMIPAPGLCVHFFSCPTHSKHWSCNKLCYAWQLINSSTNPSSLNIPCFVVPCTVMEWLSLKIIIMHVKVLYVYPQD